MRQFNLRPAIALALLGSLCTAASSATLYSNNFEVNSNGFTGAGSLQAAQSYAGFGFGTQLLHNNFSPAANSSLTVNLPAAATGVVLSFSFAAIDSWDDGSFCCGPDKFNVAVDGNGVFSQVFDNYLNAGPTVAAGLTAVSYGSDLGFNSGFNDAAYTITLSLGNLAAGPHTFDFFASGPGWQGGSDESFGIDNVLLVGVPVPEPQTYALMLAGLAGLAWRRRVA
jgi:PEP-CTERM motif